MEACCSPAMRINPQSMMASNRITTVRDHFMVLDKTRPMRLQEQALQVNVRPICAVESQYSKTVMWHSSNHTYWDWSRQPAPLPWWHLPAPSSRGLQGKLGACCSCIAPSPAGSSLRRRAPFSYLPGGRPAGSEPTRSPRGLKKVPA